MAYDDYLKAQKLALKAYKNKTVRGAYPYLPVLDEILSHVRIEREEILGTVNIPLKQVVGTSSAGRTQAFASNFMPLLDYGSEFATKWSTLYDAQIEEGIHTPIKAYEFLNKYYVIEGNKRTSVLKYVDSPTIAAEVIRKVPRLTDDPEMNIWIFIVKQRLVMSSLPKPEDIRSYANMWDEGTMKSGRMMTA